MLSLDSIKKKYEIGKKIKWDNNGKESIGTIAGITSKGNIQIWQNFEHGQIWN